VIKVLNNPANPDGEDLWGITCYFNPAGYRRRLANYRLFRERLIVPLVTVERGRDVLWQKERLLNIALNVLPDSCRKVVWLDCDIIFQGDDWPRRTSLLLERFKMVQPFSHVYLLSQDLVPDEKRPAGSELQWALAWCACDAEQNFQILRTWFFRRPS
jgi:hypothetical protein